MSKSVGSPYCYRQGVAEAHCKSPPYAPPCTLAQTLALRQLSYGTRILAVLPRTRPAVYSVNT